MTESLAYPSTPSAHPGHTMRTIAVLPDSDLLVESDGCAVLLGCAIALSALYTARDATSAASRLRLLTDPVLPKMLTDFARRAPHSPFDESLLSLSSRWLVAAVVVLEHPTIFGAPPTPVAIGGFTLAQTLSSAVHLASISPPFDRIVPQILHLTLEVTGNDR